MKAATAQERVDQIANRKKDPRLVLKMRLKDPKLLAYIKAVAPTLDPLGLVMVAYAHVQATPTLRECSVDSIIRGVAEAAQLGLSVDGVLGHAYLVPYGRSAKMLLGYRGIVHLAYQSGAVTRVHKDTICAADEWSYTEGVVPELRHVKPLTPRGELLGAYALAHLAAGGPPLIAVMGLEEIHARRARSSGYRAFLGGNIKSTPWDSDYLAMAQKCPIRELGKVIPYPVLQAATLRDEARDEGRATPEVEDKNLADVAGWTEEGESVESGARTALRPDETAGAPPAGREPGEEG
jgi:recombination protein RecT